jgi:hypothetical protein
VVVSLLGFRQAPFLLALSECFAYYIYIDRYIY